MLAKLLALLLACLLSAVVYLARTYAAPCADPITYRIGTLDERFGLTAADVLSSLGQAEAIWESTTGRNLFEYSTSGEVVINFVYDNRQRVAQENEMRKHAIRRLDGRTGRIKSRYEVATARYERAKREHFAERADYDARVTAHNQQVASWNERGGAPPDAYEEIQREARALDAAGAVLEKHRLLVNTLADRANRISSHFNSVADRLNAHVTAINTTAGREFKQGLFTHDSSGSHIDIYEYTSGDDLVHVLAHELGHSLGMGHNDNPDSIMYGLNSTRSAVLTNDDLAELSRLCGH